MPLLGHGPLRVERLAALLGLPGCLAAHPERPADLGPGGAEFSAYVGKGFASYAVKGYRTDADDALRLNGGRVGHFSRGFFPHGVRRAEVESLRAFSDTTGEPSPWITRVWS